MKRYYFLIFCTVIICTLSLEHLQAACPENTPRIPDSSEYFVTNYLRTSDFTYVDNIKSILLYKEGFEMSDPMIDLNSNEKMVLEFDDLDGDIKHYYYTLIHCDANWNRTDIWVNEYLEGTDEESIENYEHSFNTRLAYMHYTATVPDDGMRLKLSGNYLLKVYTRAADGNENIVFTRRFMVFESLVNLQASVQRASTVEEVETNQEIDFSILTGNYRVDSPYQDLQVCILQNGRWDNALCNLKPYMVKGDELDYSFDNGSNQFPGGNEFHHFDIKSLKSISDKVKDINIEDGNFHVKLWEESRRAFKVYVQDGDIDGKYLLKTDDEPSVSTMGEYVNVHFFLNYSAPIVEGTLYVGGAFNSWQFTPENKMKYNYRLHGYEADILLKQGYYNYLYTLLPNNSSKGDVTYVEGSHYETGNTYTILVYHHERGTLYDKLIAVGVYGSRK